MTVMQIREMQETDLGDVETLAIQLGYPNSAGDLCRRFREIQGLENYALLVAESGEGRVVGYIQINLDPKTLLADSRADISALIVHEAWRSQGIGAALVAEAEAWARDKGLPMIRVRSNTVRESAHRFYLREGYRVSKTSSIFTKTLD